jgi:hypothetical protein
VQRQLPVMRVVPFEMVSQQNQAGARFTIKSERGDLVN